MNLRSDFTKTKYPKFYDFYTTHCVIWTYHFHILKCLQPNCEWHSPIKRGKIELFGGPVPEKGPNDVTHDVQGNKPTEKFIPSQMEDLSKQNHGMLFMPTAQAALNVGKLIKCSECQKPCLIHAKEKLSLQNLYHWKGCWMIFNCVWNYFIRCPHGWLEPRFPNYWNGILQRNYLMVLSCRGTIFFMQNPPTHLCSLWTIVNFTTRYSRVFSQCKHCETNTCIKKTKQKQLAELDLSSKKKKQKKL